MTAGLPITNEDAWALASRWGASRYMTKTPVERGATANPSADRERR